MSAETCPVCGFPSDVDSAAPGYRCRHCQIDVRLVSCHRCGVTSALHGTVTGSATFSYRCGNCRARNYVTAQQLRHLSAEARRVERARKARERERASDDKEAQRAHQAVREDEVASLNERLDETIEAISSILSNTLEVDDYIDFEGLKEARSTAAFSPPPDIATQIPEPTREKFVPPEPRGVGRLLPGAKVKHEHALVQAEERFQVAWRAAADRERQRQELLANARAEYDRVISEQNAEVDRQHAEVDALHERFEANDPQSVVHYFSLVLESSAYPTDFPRHTRIAFVPGSKQLVVELELPGFDVVPEVKHYKYVKTRDEVTLTTRPATQRRTLYASLVAQMALRTLHELFEADRTLKIETLVLNCFVSTVDKRTGQPVQPYLVTVRTTRDQFLALNLSNVEPAECLKGLSASISASPSELAPVRPVLQFNMVDPRFIEESDVISTLDTRPNLMALTPGEFEALITNLFERMGLETRATRASRDGGVDCVAYDERPILGGKVVIQAKRYKNTVGVSAVRDLFGTLQNEGASKGILVTTSGYGKASFEFAAGKPIELLDGGNLLFLLKEHAGLDARIVPPEDWIDPIGDLGEEQSEPSNPEVWRPSN